MQYDALKTFITLVEVNNFTKTSEILHISQPSVSLHIKNLEQELQTTLFIRSPKSVQITPTGEILYNRAKQIMAITEQAKEEILAYHHEIQGTLIIGASFTIGEYILPPIIASLQQQFPQLELQIIIGNTKEIIQYTKLLQVDIGLIEGQAHDHELIIKPFMQDELFIVCASNHPLTKESTITVEDLQQQNWVAREEGSGTRYYLDHLFRANGLQVRSLLTVSSNQGVKESVIQGLGLSLLSASVIQRELKSGDIKILHLGEQHFMRTFSYLYSPTMKNKRNADTLMEAILKKA
ncbi:LysR family transcriptional regulator [Lysinibacillus pakistanensis]|uniref:LysR family transcriptional regulator n=1 Tax=Lysinibacillus pakistanensis TaxID=759811 RepID=A0AAX3WXT0_9BACI|nr:LysR family transcriptional regulator [Lysinibacillus pakistanensis]MDM5231013.1 LysR family transcriptional regulator [Lysinibacillus pakistanensis]WHY46575.1 LysR family transcriptional regulator [Lysinibacillus pakistanensis]WHY51588.1 LysR family transcriptional regulator [Lysinibacillus pakistanensis]